MKNYIATFQEEKLIARIREFYLLHNCDCQAAILWSDESECSERNYYELMLVIKLCLTGEHQGIVEEDSDEVIFLFTDCGFASLTIRILHPERDEEPSPEEKLMLAIDKQNIEDGFYVSLADEEMERRKREKGKKGKEFRRLVAIK